MEKCHKLLFSGMRDLVAKSSTARHALSEESRHDGHEWDCSPRPTREGGARNRDSKTTLECTVIGLFVFVLMLMH